MDFEIKDGVLQRYNGNKHSVTIPENVTEIGDEAFSENLVLTEVVFPSGLIKIGREAFSGCVSLENIKLPESLRIIDDWAFSECSSLGELICPSELRRIGFCAFAYCESLKTIVLNEKIKYIDNAAFEYCAVREMEIPDSVEIDECLFEGCKQLQRVKLPSSIEIIKEMTFYNCKSLQEVNIPDSVHTVERNAFYNCGKLPQDVKDRVLSLNPDCFKPMPEDEYSEEEERGGRKYKSDYSDDQDEEYSEEKACAVRSVDADKPLSEVLDREERLYEEQKPQKAAFMASAYTKMLPIVVIWIVIDGTIFLGMLFSGIFSKNPLMLLILLFFAVHMMPVWMWIHGIRKRKKEYRNLSYGISGKSVYKKRADLLEYMELSSIKGIEYFTKKGKPIGLTLTAEDGAEMDLEYLVSPDDFKSTVIRLQERANSENN